jgi:hypothetical protein
MTILEAAAEMADNFHPLTRACPSTGVIHVILVKRKFRWPG